jgi:hypothetical protein
MADRIAIVRLYEEALAQAGDEAVTAVAGFLADDIVVQSNFGVAEGKDAVLASFQNPMISAFVAGGEWTEPHRDGSTISVSLVSAPGAPIGGFEFAFVFSPDGKVERVEQAMTPASPVAPVPLRLTGEIKGAVNTALANDSVVLVAYVDPDGRPHISMRGTTQAYSDDQLAIWCRDRAGGMIGALATNPHLALHYRDPKTHMTYSFFGRGRVDDSAAVRERVFSHAPVAEQNMDFQRRGIPVIIDLDRVEGLGPGGKFVMSRDSEGSASG